MRIRSRLSLIWLLAASTFGFASPGAGESPKVGDTAPAFSLMGSDGQLHSLAEHVGKRGVVLAWFPKAFTPG